MLSGTPTPALPFSSESDLVTALSGVVARARLTYELQSQPSSLSVRLSQGSRALSVVLLRPLGPAMRVHLSMLHDAENRVLDVALDAFADLPVPADFEDLHTQAWELLAAMLSAEPWLNQVVGLPPARRRAQPPQGAAPGVPPGAP